MELEATIDELVIARILPEADSIVGSVLGEAMLPEQRLAGKTLRAVVQIIPREVVASAIDINLSNLSKLYQRKHLSRVQSEDISDLTALWEEMMGVFLGDKELLNEWLLSSLPALNGHTPKEIMQTLPGRKALREVLDCLRHGDFA